MWLASDSQAIELSPGSNDVSIEEEAEQESVEKSKSTYSDKTQPKLFALQKVKGLANLRRPDGGVSSDVNTTSGLEMNNSFSSEPFSPHQLLFRPKDMAVF